MILFKLVFIAYILSNICPLYGQTLKYIETDRPDIINPIVASKNIVGVRIMELIFRGLLTQNEKGEWIPELAISKPTFQSGASEILVYLRDDLRWPDGREITAYDVEYSFKAYMHEANNYGNRNILEIFKDVEAVNANSVRFVLAYSSSHAIYRIGFHLMPKHLLPRSHKLVNPELGYNQKPMGAGPYQIVESEESMMRFAPNPSYVRKISTSIDTVR